MQKPTTPKRRAPKRIPNTTIATWPTSMLAELDRPIRLVPVAAANDTSRPGAA